MAEKADQPRALGATELVAGVESRIYAVRGVRVMLSPDLAQLYDVETRVLMQAVRRNMDRFPADFMFELVRDEAEILRSQSVILNGMTADSSRSQTVTLKRAAAKAGRGSNIKYLPYAFTEQGVAMLSSVLRSDRAIARSFNVRIEIMRTFVKLRSMLESNKDLAKKLAALEAKYDDQFTIVFEAIRELMAPPAAPKKKPIGFIQP